MTINDLIRHLEDIREEHGNLDVVQGSFSNVFLAFEEMVRVPIVREEATLGKRETVRRLLPSTQPVIGTGTGRKVLYVGK